MGVYHISVYIYMYIHVYIYIYMLTPQDPVYQKKKFPTCFMLYPGPGSWAVLKDHCLQITSYKLITAVHITITKAHAAIVPGVQSCRLAESQKQNCRFPQALIMTSVCNAVRLSGDAYSSNLCCSCAKPL